MSPVVWVAALFLVGIGVIVLGIVLAITSLTDIPV